MIAASEKTDIVGWHTYLMREGSWDAAGSYTDADSRSFPAEGHVHVRHAPDAWTLETVLVIRDEEETVLRRRIRVRPPGPGDRAVSWESVDPERGPLLGLFAFESDAVLSRFVSEDGEHSGVETLVCGEGGSYTSYGALFRRHQLVASWTVNLVPRPR